MNKVVLAGRLVKDPELKATANGVSVCTFTVACDRRYTQNGERQADFISCIAWRQSGEFVARYFKKGNRIIIDGSIQTRSWDDGGSKHYATEVVVDHVEFGESSASQTRMGADERLTTPMSTPPASAREERSASGMRWTAGESSAGQKGVKPAGDIDGFIPVSGEDLPF